jgi:acyl-CoA synthetase (NDP forming)
MIDKLQHFFSPKTIAIVGASDDHSKWGYTIGKQALRSENCEVFLVNARAEAVLGQESYRALSEIPGELDLVVIAVPVSAFEQVIDDAIERNVKCVLAITAGFAELGAQGLTLQNRCKEKLKSKNIRMIGPNCLGISDNNRKVFLAASDFTPGNVALISQSGNLALEFDVLFKEVGIGFSRFISLGNQADVSLVEAIHSCVADSGTKIIALYVEDFIDGREFIRACQASYDAGKPIILLATSGSGAALRSAGSHTGALASESEIVATACKYAGVVKVSTPMEVAITAQVLSTGFVENLHKIGIVTDGGGHGTIACGLLEDSSFELPELSDAIQKRLQARLWPPSSVVNPVDLAGYGEQDLLSYSDSVGELLSENDIDGMLITGYFGGYSSNNPFAGGLAESEIEAAEKLIEISRKSLKPIVVHSMARDSKALSHLKAAGIPVFTKIEDAVFAFKVLRRPSITELLVQNSTFPRTTTLDYVSLRNEMSNFGLPSMPVFRVSNESELESQFDLMSVPVVLKSLSQTHKSDKNGVSLNRKTYIETIEAYQEIVASSQSKDVSIEPMIDTADSVEILVGMKRDPRFGPILIVGAGGVNAEIHKDSAMAFAPISKVQALELLKSLRVFPLLDGFRGRKKVDLESLTDLMVKFSIFVVGHSEWAECEMNPVIATPGGSMIADARAYFS